MNMYKKSLAMVMVTLLSSTGSVLAAGCQSCAEKMAIKKSLQEAAAAALAASKPASRCQEVDTLDDVKESDGKPCCQSCAEGRECEGKRCPCNKPSNNGNKPSRADAALDEVKESGVKPCCQSCAEGKECEGKRCPCANPSDEANKPSRAERDCYSNADLDEVVCLLNSLMENSTFCCKYLKDKIKHQGHEAEKCCRRVKDKIEDVETSIGSLCNSSVIDIPSRFSIVDTVDSSCLDTLTWLKSIYAVVAQIYYCTCNLG